MKKIAIVGTAMIDQIFSAKSSLDFFKCNKGTITMTPGGSMCNVAKNCAQLNLHPDFYTILGNDGFLKHALAPYEMQLIAQTINHPSPVFMYLSDQEKHMKLSTISPEFLFTYSPVKEADLIVTDNEHVLNDARFPVIFNGSIPKQIDLAAGIIVNRQEALAIYDTLEQCLADLKTKGCPWIIITCDKDGVIYYYDKIKSMPALTKENGFSLGCGDAFTAGFLKGYSLNLPFDQCVHMGQFCAKNYYLNQTISE